MKTISDVVKQMRHCSDEIELTNCYDLRMVATDTLRAWADRIEKAVTSCNSLVMRETLKEIKATLSVYHTSSLGNQEVKDYFEKIIDQALSAPPRNCDLYTEAQLCEIIIKEAQSELSADTPQVLRDIVDIVAKGVIKGLFAEAKGDEK